MSMATNRKSTEKTRPQLVRLDSVSMDEDDEILPDFEAEVDDGRRVWVTAVLERTAVIEPAPGEPKVLVNRRRLFVDPNSLRVRHLASKEAARRGVRKDNCMVKPSAVAFVPGNPNNGVGPRQWRRLPGKPPAPAK